MVFNCVEQQNQNGGQYGDKCMTSGMLQKK